LRARSLRLPLLHVGRAARAADGRAQELRGSQGAHARPTRRAPHRGGREGQGVTDAEVGRPAAADDPPAEASVARLPPTLAHEIVEVAGLAQAASPLSDCQRGPPRLAWRRYSRGCGWD